MLIRSALFLTALLLNQAAVGKEMLTIGWAEKIVIKPEKFLLYAKIDTGADNSSINAGNISFFNKGNKRYVRFVVINRDNKKITIERKVIRQAKIKRKGTTPQYRTVINMELCLGTTSKIIEVNITDRSNYKYNMLVGRSFLKGLFIVDSGKKYTVEPLCL